MAELTDEEIARRVQGGETFWFSLLIERYEDKLSRYAKKFLFDHDDREDLVQEAFVKAFVNLKSFDPKRRFSPWMYRIAHNEFLNALKKKRAAPLSLFDSDTLFPQETEEGEAGSREELLPLLEEALHKIDAKYREPLVLYYYEELDYKEIADVLRIPVSTVGVRMKRGREALKKLIDPHHE